VTPSKVSLQLLKSEGPDPSTVPPDPVQKPQVGRR